MNRRGWLPVAACAGIGLNTLRLRARLHELPVITPSDEPVHPSHVFLTADGVSLDAAARQAASAYAVREGLAVLDLVPDEMSPHQLLDLTRMVDPAAVRGRLSRGRGAFQALLAERETLARAGLDADELAAAALDPAELVDIIETLKRYAPATTGVAILPGLRAARSGPADRLALLLGAYAWDPARLLFPLARDAAILAGARSRPGWAAAALAASWVQPLAVGAVRVRMPAGQLLASPLLRRGPVLAALDAGRSALVEAVAARRAGGAGTDDPAVGFSGAGSSGVDRARPGGGHAGGQRGVSGHPAKGRSANGTGDGRRARRNLRLPGPPPADPETLAALRLSYQAELAKGLDRFFEPVRTTCPWCGGGQLSRLFTGVDVVLAKPGAFDFDRCSGCGHVFLNPQLSPEGLDFYYRDCYDGLGEAMIEELFAAGRTYLDRARLPIRPPRRWLDVGVGRGHFCNAARDVWPDTGFDGLDIGAGVEEALRRGWIDRAYRGLFPELVEELAGNYDVISMFHYLEHTRDPLAELDAVAAVLRPGGHVVIEVPNPQSPAARWYGMHWPGWLIPQHQHLIPADNLVDALAERGLQVVDLRFGAVHQQGDAPIALATVLQRLAPPPSAPWRDDPDPTRAWVRRALVGTAVFSAMPAALLLDAVSRPFLTTGRRSNAYRILARRV